MKKLLLKLVALAVIAGLVTVLSGCAACRERSAEEGPARFHPDKISVSFEGTRLTIVNQPKDQFVRTGTPAAFSVTASSSPPTPISYQWLFNCVPVPNATNSLLTLSNAVKDDVGWYTCAVAAGSNAVSIMTQPQALQVYSDLTNGIIVYGYPPPGGGGPGDPSGCPGAYKGYINVPPSSSPALFPTATSGSATDAQGNPTDIKCFQGIARWCGHNGSVSMSPLNTSKGCRFTVYFPVNSTVPLPPPPSQYGLSLTGF